MIEEVLNDLKEALKYLGIESRDFSTFSGDEWTLWSLMRHPHSGKPTAREFIREVLRATAYLGTDQKDFADLNQDEWKLNDFRRKLRDQLARLPADGEGQRRRPYAA